MACADDRQVTRLSTHHEVLARLAAWERSPCRETEAQGDWTTEEAREALPL